MSAPSRAAEYLADIARARHRAGTDWPNANHLGHINEPTTPDEWAACARMARARQTAGLPLNQLAATAINRQNRTAA